MKKIFTFLALFAVIPASAALAGEKCAPTSAQAQSFESLVQLAKDFNWTIDRMKMDDGCYTLQITDENGNVLKVKIDPATMDVVDGKVKNFAGDKK